jgi:hypothetical protein
VGEARVDAAAVPDSHGRMALPANRSGSGALHVAGCEPSGWRRRCFVLTTCRDRAAAKGGLPGLPTAAADHIGQDQPYASAASRAFESWPRGVTGGAEMFEEGAVGVEELSLTVGVIGVAAGRSRRVWWPGGRGPMLAFGYSRPVGPPSRDQCPRKKFPIFTAGISARHPRGKRPSSPSSRPSPSTRSCLRGDPPELGHAASSSATACSAMAAGRAGAVEHER